MRKGKLILFHICTIECLRSNKMGMDGGGIAYYAKGAVTQTDQYIYTSFGDLNNMNCLEKGIGFRLIILKLKFINSRCDVSDLK